MFRRFAASTVSTVGVHALSSSASVLTGGLVGLGIGVQIVVANTEPRESKSSKSEDNDSSKKTKSIKSKSAESSGFTIEVEEIPSENGSKNKDSESESTATSVEKESSDKLKSSDEISKDHSQSKSSPIVSTLLYIITALFSLLALAAAYFYFFLFNQDPKSRFKQLKKNSYSNRACDKSLLILGPCNSGKTSLWFSLRNPEKKDLPLVSSMKILRDVVNLKKALFGSKTNTGNSENSEASTIAGSEDSSEKEASQSEESLNAQQVDLPDDKLTTVELIDIPGHQNLKKDGFEAAVDATGIIYLLDGTDKTALKDGTEHLYDLWLQVTNSNSENSNDSNYSISPNKPLLICINKADRLTRGVKHIREDIEREIERMRESRAVGFEGESAADNYLGIHGEKFVLEHAPMEVSVCTCSVKNGKMDAVKDWIKGKVVLGG